MTVARCAVGAALVWLSVSSPVAAASSDVADAAAKGDRNAVRSLLQRKADVNVALVRECRQDPRQLHRAELGQRLGDSAELFGTELRADDDIGGRQPGVRRWRGQLCKQKRERGVVEVPFAGSHAQCAKAHARWRQ